MTDRDIWQPVMQRRVDDLMAELAETKAKLTAAQSTIAEKDATIEQMREALIPFASYAANPSSNVPGELVITAGSNIAKRQLTMQHCYDARTVIPTIDASTGGSNDAN